MCLIITGFKTKRQALSFKPKIAKKDMHVWKIVRKYGHPMMYKSIFQDFLYERGMHYYQTKEKNNPKFGKKVIRSIWRIDKYIIEIHQGLHAYKNKVPKFSKYITVIECVIPKGSEYYENENEIVADQLIIP